MTETSAAVTQWYEKQMNKMSMSCRDHMDTFFLERRSIQTIMVFAYPFTYENAVRLLPKSGLLKSKIKFPTQDTNIKTYRPKYITDKCQ